MKYIVENATNDDIDFLIESKLYSIFNYANNLSNDEIEKINNYVFSHVHDAVNDYKIVKCNDKKIGCYLVALKDDGVILDEIYLLDDYRNKGIGSSIIKNILENNRIVYLWVYKENKKAFSLYKKLGFEICEETNTRYYKKYNNLV